MIDINKVRMLIDSVNNQSTEDCDEATKLVALYGNNINALATSMIQHGFFLENFPFVTELSRDSWRIYSYIRNMTRYNYNNNLLEGLMNEILIKLCKAQPMKSYLRLSFRQFMNYIMVRNKTNQLIDVPHLISYMNELRASFETLCTEDRLIMKPNREGYANTDFVDGLNFLYSNAAFLISWTLIEGAKHCICLKFAPDMPASEFLNVLQKEITAPVAFNDKLVRRFLVNFLQILDKMILDRIAESSTCKHTFVASNNIEQFYQANCSIFKFWLLKNRQNIARISLKVDDPAECWRNANLKLCLDLATKYQGSSSPNKDPSLSQTLMCLNTENWYSNLSLLASSAKQLEDSPLLRGIKAMAEFRGIICEYPPLSFILSNLEGNYQKTYDKLANSSDLDQQSLVEFLDACNELSLLESNRDHIDKLESEPLKMIYKKYVESKIGTSKIPKEEVEKWLNTWSDLSELGQIDQPIRCYMDFVVPTCLNMIVRVPDEERIELVENTELLISQDFISQSLFEPSFVNKNIKIYHVLLELLKGGKNIDEKLLQIHSKDLYWNHSLYRYLVDLNLITNLRKHDKTIDLIQLRAVKYDRRHSNFVQASKIANDLIQNTTSDEIKIRSSLLFVQGNSSDPLGSCDKLQELITQIKDAKDLNNSVKNELISKTLRRILRMPFPKQETIELDLYKSFVAQDFIVTDSKAESEVSIFERWRHLFDSTSQISTCRTLLLLSKRCHVQLETSAGDVGLLNHTFSLDLRLLKTLCQTTGLSKYKAFALECATRILGHIVENHSRLSKDNLDGFKMTSFIDCTIGVWMILKTNLISVISYKDDLAADWRGALINVIKQIGQLNPNLLIYGVIVNRLDLQSELVYLNDETKNSYIQDPCSILLQSNCAPQDATQESSGRLRNCRRKLTFWNEIFDHIIESDTRWSDIMIETERFVKEIRKISFLCGEYLKTLTVKIPKKLFNFLDHFRKFCDIKTGLIHNQLRQEECYKRLKNTCDQALNPIKALLSYSNKIGESNLSKYDMWFCETFSKHLRELEYRLNLLANKKPMILEELAMLVKSITELLTVCRNRLLEYNHFSRQKLFMEMVSPPLSRLEPSLIPMPDCCNEPSTNHKKTFISIHKISQTINLIVSKTSPKKLKFIGSDGISRSFLLKAHEDLRLDQLIMDLFGFINNLFLGNCDTRNKFKLRGYSVTPVSTRSGLIQWVEAPSFCSFYKAWLDGQNGKKVVEEIYESTCNVLCEGQQSKPKSAHIHCQPPQNIQSKDLFYQLLWAKTKSTKVPITQTKPCVGNIIKYRAEFDNSVFQSIVEQLINRMPQDLLANQLWYASNNSHSYWLKTQEFIRSCAAMSIIGYIIGLGDRHPENILLDLGTGEVIHIDYNICFELGLEGGFTISCRIILDALKGYRSTLLHLLDPINLKFMIGQQSKLDETSKLLLSSSKTSAKPSVEMDMCSQESVELKPPEPVAAVTHLLLSSHDNVQEAAIAGDRVNTRTISKSQAYHSFDFQHNIKTPTKILEKTAKNIHERCRDKLSGTDECIRHYKSRQGHDERNQAGQLSNISRPRPEMNEQTFDLIMLNDAQTTEDQVEALMIESASIKNKAAMFEGWVPWI